MKDHGSITRDGFTLAYQIEGQGKPMLVVGSAMYYPRLFSEELRNHMQLIFIDHKGHVQSPPEAKPADYTLDRILDDIEAIREALAIEDFVMAGHSGNAFLAFEYARKYPEHVQKVALFNTAPTNSQERQKQSIAFFDQTASPERKKTFEQDIALLAGDIEKDPKRRFAHMCIRMGAHSFYDYTFDAASLWEGVYTNMPVIDYLWGDAFGQCNMIQSLSDINKPVFIALGRYDYLIGPASLWDSIDESYEHVRKIVFEHSGHNPMLEEAAAFDSRLIAWIDEEVDEAGLPG
ncbi:alpha/beta fold hydrolase [Aneurinibacillus sp. REN35]|uniref:alpha/beta fold hydrolase n=1 Tax=Aneurinibacillus sp. REN35 TaxID=3237286 RepID=UPI003528E4BD